MVWKILTAITILCLGGAGYFAWTSKEDIKQEKARVKSAEKNLADAKTRKGELDVALKGREEQFVAKEKERDTAKAEAEKLATTATEKEAELAVNKTNLEQKAAQVKSLEDQIRDAGDIEKLIATTEKLKKDQLDAEGAVANQMQRLTQAQSDLESVTKQITALRDAEARGRRGIVAPEFNARIAQYFPEWDFAILNKGNAGGVFANADLEVKRGRDVIAKLKVRNVEQNRSVADLVPGSLASGDSIRNGDVVVAAANQSVAVQAPAGAAPSQPGAPGATPSAEAPAPGAAPAMGSDPFGAPPAAPGAAPAMGSDPFGAPPAAPAPGAAPAMGSDPFGAPPAAPAPGAAPAMGSDPFGAPPAEAPPAAGTPAAPSTADPFATAPAPKP